MKMKSAIVAILAVAFPTVASAEPRELNAAEAQAVQSAVAEKLKDPESARFKGFRAGMTGNGEIACGYVNAKNSYGGYAGFTPFHGLLLSLATKDKTAVIPLFSVVTVGGAEISPQSVYDWCARDGIYLD